MSPYIVGHGQWRLSLVIKAWCARFPVFLPCPTRVWVVVILFLSDEKLNCLMLNYSIMAQAIKNGQCLARCLETQALDSTGFRKSVELLTLQAQKGGESWAW